jgi:hypothetical protein
MKNAIVKDDVVLNEKLLYLIEPIADEYNLRTGGKLLVTDGHRTPLMQATAMYDNEKHNRGVTYSKIALYKEIKQAFDAGFNRENYPAEKTIADMVKVIDEQIFRGQFISQHLIGRAADFSKRSPGNNPVPVDEKVLGDICRELGHFFMAEVHCFHVTFSA